MLKTTNCLMSLGQASGLLEEVAAASLEEHWLSMTGAIDVVAIPSRMRCPKHHLHPIPCLLLHY